MLLPDIVSRSLLSLRGDAGVNDPVIASRKGGGLAERTINDMVKRAAAKAGIDVPVSPHWLRHAHGSHAIDHGATLPEVQATLAHDNIATTSGYWHARPELLERPAPRPGSVPSMKLTTIRPTNRQTMRKRTVKLWRLQDDGRKLFCRHDCSVGRRPSSSAMWAAFLSAG